MSPEDTNKNTDIHTNKNAEKPSSETYSESNPNSELGSELGTQIDVNQKIQLEQITVEVTKLQDPSFLDVESEMVANYKAKNFFLKSKNPLAEMRLNEKSKVMMLTFLYTFEQAAELQSA